MFYLNIHKYKDNDFGNSTYLLRWITILCFALFPLSALSLDANTNIEWQEMAARDAGRLSITLNKSKILRVRQKIDQIAVGNAAIADALLLNQQQVYIYGRSLGSTSIQLLGKHGQLLSTIDVQVQHDLGRLQQSMRTLMADEKVQVQSLQDSIVISGNVSTPKQAENAATLAQTLVSGSKKNQGKQAAANGKKTGSGNANGKAASGKSKGGSVINLLKVDSPKQIRLDVKVAEVSRQFLRSLTGNLNLARLKDGFRVGAVSGGSTLTAPLGTSNPYSADQSFIGNMAVVDKGLFANYVSNSTMIGAVLDAAKENGQAKVLAEPTLTTSSGHEAKFVSGGEFPIPIPQSNGTVTIKFKEFGVQVKFLPVVTHKNNISLKLDVSVSELTNANSVAISTISSATSIYVPAIAKRSVQTSVELPPGQTIGIAGLISDNIRSSVNKFPGLGDLPIIGALFRSQEFVKGQTELVVLVTPSFTQSGVDRDRPLPTDNIRMPNDRDFYLRGQIQGQIQSQPQKQAQPRTPRQVAQAQTRAQTPRKALPPLTAQEKQAAEIARVRAKIAERMAKPDVEWGDEFDCSESSISCF